MALLGQVWASMQSEQDNVPKAKQCEQATQPPSSNKKEQLFLECWMIHACGEEQFGLSRGKAECRQDVNSTLGSPQVKSHHVPHPAVIQCGCRREPVTGDQKVTLLCPQLPSSRKSLSKREVTSYMVLTLPQLKTH